MGALPTLLFLAAPCAAVKQREFQDGMNAELSARPLTLTHAAAILMVSSPAGDTTQYQDRALTPMVRKKLGRGRKNRCRFCTKDGCPRPAFVDYKDVQTLKKLCTSQGKMFSRKRSGNCAAFHGAVKDAVKRARFMALMPYVGE